MKLFINDKFVKIQGLERYVPMGAFDLEISPAIPLSSIKLAGRVLIYDGTPAYMDALITLMEVRKLRKLESITFVTAEYDSVKEFLKSQFRIVKAAGGFVVRGDSTLMIHRLGKWDLPKGKLEKGEKSLAGAIREVEEECNIRVVAEEKLVSTWHTYVQDGRRILKKTTWFVMYCLDDRNMKPQAEEGIEDIQWLSRDEVQLALTNSYQSIIEVFNTYAEAKLQLS